MADAPKSIFSKLFNDVLYGDEQAIIAQRIVYILAIGLITTGGFALGGYLTPLEMGAIFLSGAALIHLFGFGTNVFDSKHYPHLWKDPYRWQKFLVTIPCVALGILSIVGYIPMYGIAIPAIVGGILSLFINKSPEGRFVDNLDLDNIKNPWNYCLHLGNVDTLDGRSYKYEVRKHVVYLLAIAMITLGAIAIDGYFNALETGSMLGGSALLMHLVTRGFKNPFHKEVRMQSLITSLIITLGVLTLLQITPLESAAITLIATGALSFLFLPNYLQALFYDDHYRPR